MGLRWQLSWWRIHLQCRRPQFDSWFGKIRWRRDRLPTPVFLGFFCGSAGKESTCNAGDMSFIPGLGRYPGEGKGYPLQYSGVENSMDCIVHGVSKSWTWLSDFHFHLFVLFSQTQCGVDVLLSSYFPFCFFFIFIFFFYKAILPLLLNRLCVFF